jgi:hypothetical protein
MDGLEPGSIFVHDQNRSEYVVKMIARNPNTLKLVVVYKARDDESLFPYYWRPLQEFRTKFTKKRGGSTDG